MLIAGDIGGTKTDLAIFSSEAGPLSPLAQARVHSADYPSLQAIVKEFLAKTKKPVDRACFALAGPVISGRVKTTNLPWAIDDASLAQELNLNTSLFNSSTIWKPLLGPFRFSDLVTCRPSTSV